MINFFTCNAKCSTRKPFWPMQSCSKWRRARFVLLSASSFKICSITHFEIYKLCLTSSSKLFPIAGHQSSKCGKRRREIHVWYIQSEGNKRNFLKEVNYYFTEAAGLIMMHSIGLFYAGRNASWESSKHIVEAGPCNWSFR